VTTTKPTAEDRLRGRMAEWEYGHEWLAALDESLAAAKREGAREAVARYREALIWCGGSDDFSPRGKAREGWEKIVLPLLDEEAANATS
jgi:hypothetical protein